MARQTIVRDNMVSVGLAHFWDALWIQLPFRIVEALERVHFLLDLSVIRYRTEPFILLFKSDISLPTTQSPKGRETWTVVGWETVGAAAVLVTPKRHVTFFSHLGSIL